MLAYLIKKFSDGVIAGIVTSIGIFLVLTVIYNFMAEGDRRKNNYTV